MLFLASHFFFFFFFSFRWAKRIVVRSRVLQMVHPDARRQYTRTVAKNIRPLSVLEESLSDALLQWKDLAAKCFPSNEVPLDSVVCSSVLRELELICSQVRCAQHEIGALMASFKREKTELVNVKHPKYVDAHTQNMGALSISAGGDKIFFGAIHRNTNLPLSTALTVEDKKAYALAGRLHIFAIWLSIATLDFEWLSLSLSGYEQHALESNDFTADFNHSGVLSEATEIKCITDDLFSCMSSSSIQDDQWIIRTLLWWYHCFARQDGAASKYFYEPLHSESSPQLTEYCIQHICECIIAYDMGGLMSSLSIWEQLSEEQGASTVHFLPFKLFLICMCEFLVRPYLVTSNWGGSFRPVLSCEKIKESELLRLYHILSQSWSERLPGAATEKLAPAVQLAHLRRKGGIWPLPAPLLISLFA